MWYKLPSLNNCDPKSLYLSRKCLSVGWLMVKLMASPQPRPQYFSFKPIFQWKIPMERPWWRAQAGSQVVASAISLPASALPMFSVTTNISTGRAFYLLSQNQIQPRIRDKKPEKNSGLIGPRESGFLESACSLTMACSPVGLISLVRWSIASRHRIGQGSIASQTFFQVLFQPLRLFIQLRGSFPLSQTCDFPTPRAKPSDVKC